MISLYRYIFKNAFCEIDIRLFHLKGSWSKVGTSAVLMQWFTQMLLAHLMVIKLTDNYDCMGQIGKENSNLHHHNSFADVSTFHHLHESFWQIFESIHHSFTCFYLTLKNREQK